MTITATHCEMPGFSANLPIAPSPRGSRQGKYFRRTRFNWAPQRAIACRKPDTSALSAAVFSPEESSGSGTSDPPVATESHPTSDRGPAQIAFGLIELHRRSGHASSRKTGLILFESPGLPVIR